jgi:hypothetical protein
MAFREDQVEIRLDVPGRSLEVADVVTMLSNLVHVFREIAADYGGDPEKQSLVVLRASTNSPLTFELEPSVRGTGRRFRQDVRFLESGGDGHDVSDRVALAYRDFATSLKRRGERVTVVDDSKEYVVGSRSSARIIDLTQTATTKTVSLMGHLDAVNVHRRPYALFLYPSLITAPRIECRFPDELLERVGGMLKKHVEVSGLGHYAMFSSWPRYIEVTADPVPQPHRNESVASHRGSLTLKPGIESVEQIDEVRNRVARSLMLS